jgi:hypothetical protein
VKRDDMNPNLLRARRRGQVAVEPKPNELQIDIDNPRALRRYGIIYAILYRHGIAKGWRERILPSRTRGHVHIIITMPDRRFCGKACRKHGKGHKIYYPLLERIGLQAILCSDPSREAFNYCRAKLHHKYPVVLFRPDKRKEDSQT